VSEKSQPINRYDPIVPNHQKMDDINISHPKMDDKIFPSILSKDG
jgi:hypothetical protein